MLNGVGTFGLNLLISGALLLGSICTGTKNQIISFLTSVHCIQSDFYKLSWILLSICVRGEYWDPVSARGKNKRIPSFPFFICRFKLLKDRKIDRLVLTPCLQYFSQITALNKSRLWKQWRLNMSILLTLEMLISVIQ